jgi:hypothetical protein
MFADTAAARKSRRGDSRSNPFFAPPCSTRFVLRLIMLQAMHGAMTGMLATEINEKGPKFMSKNL